MKRHRQIVCVIVRWSSRFVVRLTRRQLRLALRRVRGGNKLAARQLLLKLNWCLPRPLLLIRLEIHDFVAVVIVCASWVTVLVLQSLTSRAMLLAGKFVYVLLTSRAVLLDELAHVLAPMSVLILVLQVHLMVARRLLLEHYFLANRISLLLQFLQGGELSGLRIVVHWVILCHLKRWLGSA